MAIANLMSIGMSGAAGGLCAAVISDRCNQMKGIAVSTKERVLQFLSRTFLGAISAVAAHALASYIGYALVQGGIILGCTIYALYHRNSPENDLAHGTTAKVLAMVCGASFSFVPWQSLLH